jgi:hypothetical protein
MFVINRGPRSNDLYPNEIIMLNGFMFDLLDRQNQLLDKSQKSVGNKFTTDKVFNSLLMASGVLEKETKPEEENLSMYSKLTDDIQITTELIKANKTAFQTIEAGLDLVNANLKLILEGVKKDEPKVQKIKQLYDEFRKFYQLIRDNRILIKEEDLKTLNQHLQDILKEFGNGNVV